MSKKRHLFRRAQNTSRAHREPRYFTIHFSNFSTQLQRSTVYKSQSAQPPIQHKIFSFGTIERQLARKLYICQRQPTAAPCGRTATIHSSGGSNSGGRAHTGPDCKQSAHLQGCRGCTACTTSPPGAPSSRLPCLPNPESNARQLEVDYP